MKSQTKVQKHKFQCNFALLTEERQRRLKALKTQLIKEQADPLSGIGNSQNTFITKLLDSIPIIRLLRLRQTVHPKEMLGENVENYQVLFSPQRVKFGVNEIDREFLKVCLYYQAEYFDRSEIFVCDVVPAYIHIGLV
jgi:hypothetical protein